MVWQVPHEIVQRQVHPFLLLLLQVDLVLCRGGGVCADTRQPCRPFVRDMYRATEHVRRVGLTQRHGVGAHLGRGNQAHGTSLKCTSGKGNQRLREHHTCIIQVVGNHGYLERHFNLCNGA